LGSALFAVGNLHQFRYHRTLANLRSKGSEAVAEALSAAAAELAAAEATAGRKTEAAALAAAVPAVAAVGAKEYKIPYGGWFEYVSCPHYTAEIMLYAGLVVAAVGWCS